MLSNCLRTNTNRDFAHQPKPNSPASSFFFQTPGSPPPPSSPPPNIRKARQKPTCLQPKQAQPNPAMAKIRTPTSNPPHHNIVCDGYGSQGVAGGANRSHFRTSNRCVAQVKVVRVGWFVKIGNGPFWMPPPAPSTSRSWRRSTTSTPPPSMPAAPPVNSSNRKGGGAVPIIVWTTSCREF